MSATTGLQGFFVYEEYPDSNPGWVTACCELCYRNDAYSQTDGLDSVVEDWAYEHMADHHPRFFRKCGNRL